jgi:hypothetical protein
MAGFALGIAAKILFICHAEPVEAQIKRLQRKARRVAQRPKSQLLINPTT